MPPINALPAEIWSDVCTYLDPISICALHATTRDIREKTVWSMSQTLKTITVTSSKDGIQRLQKLILQKKVAAKVERVILYPTSNKDQSRVMKKITVPKRNKRILDGMLDFGSYLRHHLVIILRRFPNLKVFEISNHAFVGSLSYPLSQSAGHEPSRHGFWIAVSIFETLPSNVELKVTAEPLRFNGCFEPIGCFDSSYLNDFQQLSWFGRTDFEAPDVLKQRLRALEYRGLPSSNQAAQANFHEWIYDTPADPFIPEMTHYPNLTELTVSDLRVEKGAMMKIVERHRITLRKIWFHNIDDIDGDIWRPLFRVLINEEERTCSLDRLELNNCTAAVQQSYTKSSDAHIPLGRSWEGQNAIFMALEKLIACPYFLDDHSRPEIHLKQVPSGKVVNLIELWHRGYDVTV
ncbi:hypothetical protein CC80DRAFT_572981 [Byssothecium circinans]|uniref:F-box domain-containing protein n=1 Tax=Byssothecium circinans TaxID=147558 RepID=A0A6A5TH79_9PLEO|nr:hypothetical protein CC80DRAFT_572981 [Byssothecium circinans]